MYLLSLQELSVISCYVACIHGRRIHVRLYITHLYITQAVSAAAVHACFPEDSQLHSV